MTCGKKLRPVGTVIEIASVPSLATTDTTIGQSTQWVVREHVQVTDPAHQMVTCAELVECVVTNGQ